MTVIGAQSQPSTTTLAPADRAAGTRGLRARLSGVAAVAALLPLSFCSFPGNPGWARFAFGVAAAALLGAALLLWVARRPRMVAIGGVLAALGVAGAVAAYAEVERLERERKKWGGASFRHEARGRILTDAQAEAVPEGATKAELTARLGTPAGSGVQRVFGEPDMRCLAYRAEEGRGTGVGLHAFCFRHGRYAALRPW